MIRIQKEPLESSDLLAILTDIKPGFGGSVIFAGYVRDDGMDHLVFEADIIEAEKELGRIVAEAEEAHGPLAVRIIHRYGRMEIGEIIVLISVAAGHRDAAYAASRYIIDELKVRVPIWKADVFGDSVSWIPGEKENSS